MQYKQHQKLLVVSQVHILALSDQKLNGLIAKKHRFHCRLMQTALPRQRGPQSKKINADEPKC